MMVYKVYHRTDPIRPDELEQLTCVELSDYDLVAEVLANSLSEVYYKTTTPEGRWGMNKGVKTVRESRPTRAGDIAVELIGTAHLLKSMVWDRVILVDDVPSVYEGYNPNQLMEALKLVKVLVESKSVESIRVPADLLVAVNTAIEYIAPRKIHVRVLSGQNEIIVERIDSSDSRR